MNDPKDSDFFADSIVDLDSDNLQCPLCSNTHGLRLVRLAKAKSKEGTLAYRYRLVCSHCDTTIFFTRHDDIEARRTLAYSRPERGKEHEDYERN